MPFFFRAKSPTQTFLLAHGRGTFRCAVNVNGVAGNVPSCEAGTVARQSRQLENR